MRADSFCGLFMKGVPTNEVVESTLIGVYGFECSQIRVGESTFDMSASNRGLVRADSFCGLFMKGVPTTEVVESTLICVYGFDCSQLRVGENIFEMSAYNRGLVREDSFVVCSMKGVLPTEGCRKHP